MVWGYIKSRETARRMESYAGEVSSGITKKQDCLPPTDAKL